LGARRRGLHLFEPVDEPERLGVEQGELLLDCNGEVCAALERRTGGGELLLGGKALFLAHGPRRLRDRRQKARGDTRPGPPRDDGPARRSPDRFAVGRRKRDQRGELLAQVGGVAGGEGRQSPQMWWVLLLETVGDLGEPAVAGDERRTATGRRLG